MRIIERGLIFDSRGKPEGERAPSCADLCATRSGALFSTFQIGPVKNAVNSTLSVHRSRDQGRTWQRLGCRLATEVAGVPGSLSTAEMVEVQPGRLLLMATWIDRSDPARPLFDPVTEGILPTKILKAFSTDEGDSWSSWEEVRLPGMRFCPHGSGPMVQWADGAVALPLESHKAFDDPDPARKDVQASWLIVSRDFGRTFTGPYLVAQHPEHTTYYWDQRVCAGRRPGEFIALFWTHDRKLGRDIDVHMRHGSVGEGGIRLEPIHGTGIPGQIAAPVVLPDGRIWALVVDRRRPGKIALWESADDGKQWRELPPAYEHGGTTQSAYSADSVEYAEVWETLEKWRFGHPAIRILNDRQALITHYAGTQEGLNIHWARAELAP